MMHHSTALNPLLFVASVALAGAWGCSDDSFVPLEDGSACSSNAECASGYCNQTTSGALSEPQQKDLQCFGSCADGCGEDDEACLMACAEQCYDSCDALCSDLCFGDASCEASCLADCDLDGGGGGSGGGGTGGGTGGGDDGGGSTGGGDDGTGGGTSGGTGGGTASGATGVCAPNPNGGGTTDTGTGGGTDAGTGGGGDDAGTGGGGDDAGTGGGGDDTMDWSGTWTGDASYAVTCEVGFGNANTGEATHSDTFVITVNGGSATAVVAGQDEYTMTGTASDTRLSLSGTYPVRDSGGDITRGTVPADNAISIRIEDISDANTASGSISGQFQGRFGADCTIDEGGTITLLR